MMSLLKDKRGFLDPEVIMSPGFIALAILSVGAIVIGWFGGKSMGFDAFPLWNILVFIPFDLAICYVITIKMLD